MNKFINKILKEAKNSDDPFFKPKTKKRDEEERKRRKEILLKIKLGLRNIKVNYENKDWNSELEELFLKIFSKSRLIKKYNEWWNGYYLLNEKNTPICAFDLRYDTFWVSYDDVWLILKKGFLRNHDDIEHFMINMLKKHFKLYEFTMVKSFT